MGERAARAGRGFAGVQGPQHTALCRGEGRDHTRAAHTVHTRNSALTRITRTVQLLAKQRRIHSVLRDR